LRDPLVHQPLIDLVVDVHRRAMLRAALMTAKTIVFV